MLHQASVKHVKVQTKERTMLELMPEAYRIPPTSALYPLPALSTTLRSAACTFSVQVYPLPRHYNNYNLVTSDDQDFE